ncbi:NUDIX domain-containing protein [Cohnella herbarum]|uniref:NUDIX domain-containing protein n=1 Tax=Cohnella herbarum TaxID=2728023 RepID=A0A7Z2VT03_9BACL|nr:NUDIX domain-containing protein [Cohnella herbarum]QJD83271.1 NUDIX domain-containing protein [Cohnella herbarum]QJD88502.1 NUDIX domain-containing protein [Cohnella herbarum]
MFALNIRTAARAVIIKDEELLVLRRTGVQGAFYVLPGGGQNHGESIIETLKREVKEEVDLEVIWNELIFINEFIARRDSKFFELEPQIHQIDFTFHCTVNHDRIALVGQTPDLHQVGIAWIPINEIIDYVVHPKDDLNFIMGAPTRDALTEWIMNRSIYKTPRLIEG